MWLYIKALFHQFLYPIAPVPPVTNFRVIEEGLFSLKVAWTPPLGKLEGYKVYIPGGEFSFLGACCEESSDLRAGKMPFHPRKE